MAATSVTVSCPGGNLEGLSKLVQARAQALKQTTEDAVRYTAVNVLKSLRADTPVVKKNPAVIPGRWKVEILETTWKSGWARPPRSGKDGRRVIRNGGHAVDVSSNGNRIVNLAGAYGGAAYERSLKVYSVKITEVPATKPFYDSLIIAPSRTVLDKFVQKRIVRRIEQYRGVSKRVLGLAMHEIVSSQKADTSGQIGALAQKMVNVRTSGNGYSAGTFALSFADGLSFSAAALKSGSAGVMNAMKRAANATAAILTRHNEKLGIDKKFTTPFPEVAKKKAG